VKKKYPRTIIYERPTTNTTRQGTYSRQSYPCAPYFHQIDASFGKTDGLQRISVHRSEMYIRFRELAVRTVPFNRASRNGLLVLVN
jgi:hypothetical protein